MRIYRKEVNKIRKKSFSEIEGAIWIIEIPFSVVGGMVLFLFGNVKLLIFTSKSRSLSKGALRGMIAHELSHFSIFQKGGWWGFWKHVFTLNKRRFVAIEKRTDRLAIKRGYGKDLITLKDEVGELLSGTRQEKYLDNYLTVSEVRDCMKKNC